MHLRLFLCLGLLLGFSYPAGLRAAGDWPSFRGPTGQGVATAVTAVPVQLDVQKGVRWRIPIAGKAWSSPVVQNGQVWLTTAVAAAPTAEQLERLADDPQRDMKEIAGHVSLSTICIDAETGDVLHDILLAEIASPDVIHPLNTYASPTPVLDRGRVYCSFGAYGTWCLDTASGKELWSRQVKLQHSVGPGSSPILVGQALVLVCDGIDQQFVTALDKTTGEVLWRTDRPPIRAADVEAKKAYSTPIAIEVQGQQQIVVPGAQWICGYDPLSGKELWRIDHGDGFSVSPTPIYSNGLVIFSTGYMRAELVAVRPDGHGDVTNSHVQWRVSRGVPFKPSPISVDNRLYMISDTGILTQLSVTDGNILWQERLSGNFSASPIAVGDKLYFSSHEGIVTVVQVGDEYHEVARNELEGQLMASPAIIDNDLLIRTDRELIRFSDIR